MGEYGQCRIHQITLEQRAKVCGREEQRMCDGIFRYRKYKLGYPEGH
jgi:hypothetical protein